MAWFMRFTRFADIHAVYAQEAPNSCGIACVMMSVFKLNKLVPGSHALHTETEIDWVYGRVAHTTYNGSAYTYASHLAGTLNHLRVGTWKAENVGADKVPGVAVDAVGTYPPGPVLNYPKGKAPVIVLVGWNQGGAHFVVIDTVVAVGDGLYASVCDPWDGNVHVTPLKLGTALAYTGAPVPWSWDMGGEKHEYTGEQPGAGNGWVVRRTH